MGKLSDEGFGHPPDNWDNDDNGNSGSGQGNTGDREDRALDTTPIPDPPAPTMLDRLDAYMSPQGAADFAMGAAIAGLAWNAAAPVGWGFPAIATMVAVGIGNVILQEENRRVAEKKARNALNKILRNEFRQELKRNLVKPGSQSKPKPGKDGSKFFKPGVNETRLCTRKASDKICKKLGVKTDEGREAVWAEIQRNMFQVCRQWNRNAKGPIVHMKKKGGKIVFAR